MNIEQFRDFCLSLPGVREGTPFRRFPGAESVLVFYAGDKMFCYFDMDRFDACTIKCAPERIAGLKERYRAVGDPYNGNAKYWIGIRFNNDMPDGEITALVRDSFDLVAAKTRKI